MSIILPNPANPRQIHLPANEWIPRKYQWALWRAMMIQNYKRAISVWHRRAGKDWNAINIAACKSQQRVGLYWHLFPTYAQGKKIVWNGKTYEGRPFLSAFPPELVEDTNEQLMRVRLTNGSIYQVVGMDDPDSLVGPNVIGMIFSEFAVANPRGWDLLEPMLAENNGWAMFISTPRGHNHLFKMLEVARKFPEVWFSEVLSIRDTTRPKYNPENLMEYLFDMAGNVIEEPCVTEDFINQKRAEGKDEALLQQEYYCSFDAPMQGAYYAAIMSKLLEDGFISKDWVHDPAREVYTAWDIGFNDATVIWFYQIVGNLIHFIDYYSASGEGPEHYADVIKARGAAYNYAQYHNGPWDGEHKNSQTGKTYFDIMRGLGIKFRKIERGRVEEGISQCRVILPRCRFNIDKCYDGVDALRSYRKEYDAEHKTFRNKPLHDFSSNGADAFRCFAMSLKSDTSGPKGNRPTSYLKQPAFIN